MTPTVTSTHPTADEFAALVSALRPRLHRYCARMAGSALDGEDIVQDALAKAALGARLYAERFNARDFDGLRALLAEEVRLDLAGRLVMKGKAEVSNYFGNYAGIEGWRAVPGAVEGRAGLWVHEADAARPAYPIVLSWREDGSLQAIRDFRYARYVAEALRR